jgi:hypothetical protein
MFVASGSLTTIDGPAFFKPAPFATLDEAVTASLVWAEQNEVPFVYVRAGQASGRCSGHSVFLWLGLLEPDWLRKCRARHGMARRTSS